ncbi:MAG: class B sortase [Lachnospiraceae bacterium]|nr:class B sortase [Lachnospiraceae bacterium]
MANTKQHYIKTLLLLLLVCSMTGCGQNSHKETAIATESAADSQINFTALKEENPNIFAWLYIPDTRIDCPVLQDSQTDDFYSNHNAFREDDAHGAVYIELANVTNMCDFNTVLHGNSPEKPDSRKAESYPFADLYNFANPTFFDEHEKIYLYLDGNKLTYEVFAAYEQENTSLIRDYDFTDYIGCLMFLNDLYSNRDLSMNLRDGWSFITPYHFLITLTAHKEGDPDHQFVVVAVLTQDDAGTISRVVEE